ncbi:MAG: hypothetical protein CM1200mP2_34400 [Planctomycetaceae bacterium]|nr:MAG: hypothetical protein CM1200mP2_34400 [Planctomycetaceae bacterium]
MTSTEGELAIGTSAAKSFSLERPVRPKNLDTVEVVGFESYVDARVVTGHEAAGRVEDPVMFLVAADDDQFRAIGVSAVFWIDQLEAEPVALLGHVIAVQTGAAAGGGHQQVDITVIVDVAANQAATGVRTAAEVTRLAGAFDEAVLAGVEVELVAVGVFLPVGNRVGDPGLAGLGQFVEVDDVTLAVGVRTPPPAGKGQSVDQGDVEEASWSRSTNATPQPV